MTTATTTAETPFGTGLTVLATLAVDPHRLEHCSLLKLLLRRQLTAVAADLSRSAALTSALDSEDSEQRRVLVLNRRWIATDCVQALFRAISSLPPVLTRVSYSAGGPVSSHGNAHVCGPIARQLLINGARHDELTTRRISDHALTGLSRTLADLTL